MSRRTPKVVYWNHSPTPYFVERFNAVAERGNVDFEAWFNTRREAMRSWDVDESGWRFRARYIPARGLGPVRAQVPVPELAEARPDLLVQEYDRGHLALGFAAGTRLAGRTAFRVLPNYDTWSRRTWWREAGKHCVFAAVDAVKTPGPEGAALARRYGLPGERVVLVTQSVDTHRLTPDSGERERTRARLGLRGCVFLYAGRLWRGKGLDDLFDAYAALHHERAAVSLLLAGDGPDEAHYRARAAGLRDVLFAGFAQADELLALYRAADALVFPTLGDPHGLVVEEAMSAGLPVIASASAGDIRLRLPEGEAGWVVPPADPDALRGRMAVLAADRELRVRLGKRARELVRERSHERYAQDFEAFVAATLARPRRSGPAARSMCIAGRVLERTLGAQHAVPVLSPTTDRRPLAHSV
jgi:glycosyltransferase involved in cell wall biosynthesis